MRYYDLKRNWKNKIQPHLIDKELNKILVRDFNKFTWGTWNQKFNPGQVPREFETCLWEVNLPEFDGPEPEFWKYTKHAACHWIVNFSLKLAQLSLPKRDWRIITSKLHSTVWDGNKLLFDFNFYAFGVKAKRCFEMAYINKKELPIGKCMRIRFAEHINVRYPK